jgi:hypothetical protein
VLFDLASRFRRLAKHRCGLTNFPQVKRFTCFTKFVTPRTPRVRVSKLTASVHLVEILLQEIAKSAHKVFDSLAQSVPRFVWDQRKKPPCGGLMLLR